MFVALVKALDQRDGQYGQPYILNGAQSFAQAATIAGLFLVGRGWTVNQEAPDLLYAVKSTATGNFEYEIAILEAEQINLRNS